MCVRGVDRVIVVMFKIRIVSNPIRWTLYRECVECVSVSERLLERCSGEVRLVVMSELQRLVCIYLKREVIKVLL